MPPFYLIPGATTDWVRERARREGESAGGFNRSVALATHDVNRAARTAGGAGYNAASARDAAQAMAPEVARLRSNQASALGEVRAGIAADQEEEANRTNTFMNNMVGGLAGMAGQMMVPAIGAMTGGAGAPAAAGLGSALGLGGGRSPFGAPPAAAAPAPMAPPPPQMPAMGAPAAAPPGAPAAAGAGRLPGESEEDYRRRMGMA